jgi:hypothetical protein
MRRTAAALAFATLACGAPEPAIDAGSDAGPPPLEWPELAVGTTVDPVDDHLIGPDAQPPDLSCLGVWEAPEPGALTTTTIRVTRNSTEFGIPDFCLRPYPDDIVGPATPCGTDDLRTDADGFADVPVYGDALFSLRFFAHEGVTSSEDTLPVLHLHLTPSVTEDLLAPTRSILTAVSLGINGELAPGRAVVAFLVTDCARRPLFGARIRIARADGTYLEPGLERVDVKEGYFDASALADPRQFWTHIGGIGGYMNLPVEAGPVFVEVWGRRPGSDELEVIGCSTAVLEPDTGSTLFQFAPYFASHPACPGLR